MKKIIFFTFLSAILFVTTQKAWIEFYQNNYPDLSNYFYIAANISQLLFFVLLVILMCKGVCHFTKLTWLRAIMTILVFFTSCTMTLISGREILNLSRPADPNTFITEKSITKKLTDLADEMIKKENVFWVGNNSSNFIFGIKYNDGNFQFDSSYITDDYDFNTPLNAEDLSKTSHPDLPFISNELKPTDSKIVNKSDYVFCKKASNVIKKIGFDNIKLYPEYRVVQYQIYDFLGWDNGRYIVYYYCPDPNLPNKFEYSKKLNDNWYYIQAPRFAK
jgi:hypothetical protein